jgi:polyhydroxyalkanoate synthesis regulator phasin
MSSRRKLLVGAGAGAFVLVVASLGAAGAIAAGKVFSPGEETKAVIDDAAAQLGIEPSELSDALKQALENRIDEAVDEGRLTEEQATRLKDRLGESAYPLLFGMGMGPGPRGHGFGFGFGQRGPFIGHFAIFDTAAEYLGMSEAELREAMRDQTLAQIAKEKGKTAAGLVNELVATQTKRIDEAVDEGKLTDEQAASLKEGLESRMEALVNGELRRPHAGKHRFWPGSWAPRAPPEFRGPSA